ncbi:MAG TPA: DUF3754 domain-containing protein [Phycisphaerae bacterium]|nr:DUF3754 domain-containing protein [Phycisphaerae bacterium]HRY67992.1 DUF3754 domain-containing protein [Phycisphaerae bacterium]HSA26729.1 DUF3754 domain-containing protein [Phycisphaerae bacterium]
MRRSRSQLIRDPTAHVECHHVDNRFVPLRVCDLARALEEDYGSRGTDRGELAAFVEALVAVIEQEAGAFERELEDRYSFFNPDRETLPLGGDLAARVPEGYRALDAQLRYLLDKANFERLDDVAVDRAIRVASSHGFRVQLDPSRVEDFCVFVRGMGQVERTRRCLKAPIRGTRRSLLVHRRLVVIARLKGDAHILLKMFKDIPEEDVEALLPHAEITMNWIDRLFMLGGGAGAIGSTTAQVAKIISAGLMVVSRLLWVVVFGAAVLFWRTLTGYRAARAKRDSQRTRHLYFQNISNNSGTIQMLISMTAQEEIKEAALAYVLCACGAGFLASEAELGAKAESYLRDRFGIQVDFDVADAVRTLDRLGLWDDREGMRVIPLAQAVARLRDHWLHHRSRDHHRDRAAEGVRDRGCRAASIEDR